MKRGAAQGTPAWVSQRRGLVTGTDLAVLLGLSPYKSEAQLADEKRGLVEQAPSTPVMRLGLALEPFLAVEYSRATGRRVRRVNKLRRHPSIDWAAASLDREAIGEHRVVELKTTGSRRWEDGLPQDVESQVRWQLGVVGYPVADVAVWRFGTKDPLAIYEVEHDPAIFDGLVAVADDFRARLAAGGPFAMDSAYLRDRYPQDDGTEIVADADVTDAVHALLDVRGRLADLKATSESLEAAVKARMAEATRLSGEGFAITWKRTKDRTETDWRALSEELLADMPEPDRAAVVGRHVMVQAGFRPFRVTTTKGDPE